MRHEQGTCPSRAVNWHAQMCSMIGAAACRLHCKLSQHSSALDTTHSLTSYDIIQARCTPRCCTTCHSCVHHPLLVAIPLRVLFHPFLLTPSQCGAPCSSLYTTTLLLCYTPPVHTSPPVLHHCPTSFYTSTHLFTVFKLSTGPAQPDGVHKMHAQSLASPFALAHLFTECQHPCTAPAHAA